MSLLIRRNNADYINNGQDFVKKVLHAHLNYGATSMKFLLFLWGMLIMQMSHLPSSNNHNEFGHDDQRSTAAIHFGK